MKALILFIQNNWPIIVPVVVASVSEFMALHPQSKANGVLHFLLNLIAPKKNEG